MLLDYIKRYAKSSILISILMLIVSILLIIRPSAILNTIMLLIGTVILLEGIFHIVTYVIGDKEYRTYSKDLLIGIIIIISGIYIILNKEIFINLLPIIVGIWIVIKSVIKLQLALNLKNLDDRNWLILFISSIITSIFGIVIILNPFASLVAITILVGMVLLTTQIIEIIENVFLLNKLK